MGTSVLIWIPTTITMKKIQMVLNSWFEPQLFGIISIIPGTTVPLTPSLPGQGLGHSTCESLFMFTARSWDLCMPQIPAQQALILGVGMCNTMGAHFHGFKDNIGKDDH